VLNRIFFAKFFDDRRRNFIINGCERVVINNYKKPGVYWKEFGTRRKTVYTATIISIKALHKFF
jgi:DNA-directed RNA polymerase beta subunit